MFPLTRVPIWYRLFEPQPCGRGKWKSGLKLRGSGGLVLSHSYVKEPRNPIHPHNSCSMDEAQFEHWDKSYLTRGTSELTTVLYFGIC